MTQIRLKRLVTATAFASLFAALFLFRAFYRVDNTLSDYLYQKPQALEGNIVLVNIDQRALETIGPFQTWERSVMADVIDTLNADPDSRPAVIGIDTIFAGTTDPAEDARLIEAAGRYGNVLLAVAAGFGTDVVTTADGSFRLDQQAVQSFDEPFPALKEASKQGHINAMYDKDGVLRHCLLYVSLPDGRQIPSFHYQIAQMYAEHVGMELTAPPTDRHFRWYLPYQAEPGGFNDGFSAADVLAGELPSELFADKIVLIGPYAAGLNDTVTSAIDHARPMFGVEYQANAIGALLEGDFKREVPLFPQAAIIFVVSFFGLLWFRSRKILASTISWLILTAASLGGSILCFRLGYVVNSLYLPLSITILYMISVADNYARAAFEKKRVTATFARYVAPEIVHEILREGSESLKLGGKLTDIAVLFVDLRGFTTMSEGMEPPQIVEILNRYLTLTSDCILKNNGTLDKFVGDCTMAFWGAPLPQEDCIYKAVKTALDMVEGSKQLSEELLEQYGRTVSFGVGVHYGPAVVGNIGAPNRMDYTAIGDTVNTSARLEANAPGGKILVSRVVADALDGRVRFTSLGDSIRLKGKAAGFEILTVDGLEPTEAERDNTLPRS